MKKIVLIEDDADLFALLKYNLEKEGFTMTGLQTGSGAVEFCRQTRPDLILLDIMLPDSDGLDICKGIRKDPDLAATPVIFLTARASETDRIVGLEIGANDYVVKPFFVRELIARIKLQFRSTAAARPRPRACWKSAGLELDSSSRQVRLQGAPLALTATEFRLLEFLMSRPGVVFSREQLLNAVWGQDRAITDRAVDVYVLRLRQKIETDPARARADPLRARIRIHLRAAQGCSGSVTAAAALPVHRGVQQRLHLFAQGIRREWLGQQCVPLLHDVLLHHVGVVVAGNVQYFQIRLQGRQLIRQHGTAHSRSHHVGN